MNENEKMTKEVKRQVIKMSVIIGALLLVAILVWSYNLFRLKEISYEGLTRYTEEEFSKKLQGSFLSTCTPFFCMTDTFHEKEIPFIETYEIRYQSRHSVKIVVHEKRVVGCIALMGRYLYFDKDGIIVESAETLIEDVPIVEGLEFKELVLYQKLEIQKQSLFDTILELTRLIEENGLTVQKITFSPDYQVTLSSGSIEIQLGKRTSYDEPLQALKGILAVAGERKGTLDMRNYSKENPDVILKQ